MAAKRKFVVGDVVRLKSGSPQMTVNNVYDEYVNTAWFVEGKVLTSSFHPITLERIEN